MYDKLPFVAVSENEADCLLGWDAIGVQLRQFVEGGRRVICCECYPGVNVPDVLAQLTVVLTPSEVISTEDLLLSPEELELRLEPMLTADPVFGVLSGIELKSYFDPEKLMRARTRVQDAREGLVLIVGTGALEVAPLHDALIYADMARWEIQMRQRRGEIGNLGARNETEPAAKKYKRSFFWIGGRPTG